MSLYETHDNDPMLTGTLRNRFHMAACLLWARGLPPPTANEIADAMTEALVKVDGPVYRIIKTQWVEGDVFVMQNGKYLGRLVEVGEEQP